MSSFSLFIAFSAFSLSESAISFTLSFALLNAFLILLAAFLKNLASVYAYASDATSTVASVCAKITLEFEMTANRSTTPRIKMFLIFFV